MNLLWYVKLHVLFFCPQGRLDLCSPSRDWTHIPWLEGEVLATGPTEESPPFILNTLYSGLFVLATLLSDNLLIPSCQTQYWFSYLFILVLSVQFLALSLPYYRASKGVPWWTIHLPMETREMWVPSLGLEEEVAAHCSVLAWRIPMDGGAWRATVHGVTKETSMTVTATSPLQNTLLLWLCWYCPQVSLHTLSSYSVSVFFSCSFSFTCSHCWQFPRVLSAVRCYSQYVYSPWENFSKALLRYKSHAIQSSHLKYTIQCFLVFFTDMYN